MSVVTFGEVMARMATPGFLRWGQAVPGDIEVTFAGAEANVAASLALWGCPTRLVTALPTHALAEACVSQLRRVGIDTDSIVRMDQGRLGLYFLETGANQRPSRVVYDRAGSTFAQAAAQSYDWESHLDQARWLHTTGITPAVSAAAAEATLAALQTAKRLGVTVSCDLNYRSKLWDWEPSTPPRDLAERTMRELLPSVDVLIANEADCADVLRIRAAGSDVDRGRLDADRYPEVACQVLDQFPNLRWIGITLRESLSATHNRWGAMLFDGKTHTAHFAPMVDGRYHPYDITSIVDRVGAGDAFAAGLIYSLIHFGPDEPERTIGFATASSCLAHSVRGDFHYSTLSEIEAFRTDGGSGRVVR